MKTRILFSLALLVLGGASRAPAPCTVVGDYVEVRTASVFAGACHYNGELVTTGHDAIMAWNIVSGSYEGVDLAGVKAMAAVSSTANLGDDQAARKSEVMVGAGASDVQANAFVDYLRNQSSGHMGQIMTVRRGAVAFAHDSVSYDVKAGGFASLTVEPMPNNECCLQPNLVWYSPLMQLDHRKVGFTKNAEYIAGTMGDAWQQAGDNSAFYGMFGAL